MSSMFQLPKTNKRLERKQYIKNLNKSSGLRIHNFGSIPAWQQDNRYIFSGYRMNISFKECILSLMDNHNDATVIWTSIFALVYIGYIFGVAYISETPSHTHSFLSSLFFIATSAFFLISSVNHTFKVISQGLKATLDRLESASFILLLTSSFFPVLHYSYDSFVVLKGTYDTAIIVAGVIALVLSQVMTNNKGMRGVHIGALLVIAVGLFPIIQAAFAIRADSLLVLTDPIIKNLFQTYALYVVAVLIQWQKFPEQLSKGTFDYFLSSKDLFVAIIFMAVLLQEQIYTKIFTEFVKTLA